MLISDHTQKKEHKLVQRIFKSTKKLWLVAETAHSTNHKLKFSRLFWCQLSSSHSMATQISKCYNITDTQILLAFHLQHQDTLHLVKMLDLNTQLILYWIWPNNLTWLCQSRFDHLLMQGFIYATANTTLYHFAHNSSSLSLSQPSLPSLYQFQPMPLLCWTVFRVCFLVFSFIIFMTSLVPTWQHVLQSA